MSTNRALATASHALFQVRHYCPDVPIILVGTKVDQRDNAQVVADLQKQGSGVVSFTEGLKLARDINAYQYIECSALRGKKVGRCSTRGVGGA